MPTMTHSLSHAVLGALPVGDHSFTSIVLAILGVGFLIFIHETGHFLACRLTKTRVETFSIGFGKRLFGWESRDGVRRFTVGERRSLPTDGTDVRIAMIPLGGYVKMAGEIGGDGTATSGSSAPPRAPLPDEYPAKSFGARSLIISAGVIMNAITAFVFFWIAYGTGVEDLPPVLGQVARGGAGWRAGLLPGDRVESIDGRTVRTFVDIATGVALVAKGTEAEVVVERDGVRRTVRLTPDYDETRGLQQAQMTPSVSLTIDDGVSEKLVVGSRERAVVSGREVRGGAEFESAVSDALLTGRESIEVILPERPQPGNSRIIPLARARKAPTKPGPFKLGITFVDRRRIEAIRPGGTAERSGLLAGDVVVRVDASAVSQPADLSFRSGVGTLEVLRNGTMKTLDVRVDGFAAVNAFLDDVAFVSKPGPGPTQVFPGGGDFPDRKSPAAEAGVLPGDVLLELNGQAVTSHEDVVAAGAKFDGSPVILKVRTGVELPREVSVTPRPLSDAKEREAFLSGIHPKERVEVGGWGGAASVALTRTRNEIVNTFRLIGRFFGGGVSFQKNISGPLTIANLASQSAAEGVGVFLLFLAFISVNLCVLNFLPIPVLDGGQMLFLLIEKARGGRRLSDATIAKFQLVGFVLLMVLMVFAFKNDITNVFG